MWGESRGLLHHGHQVTKTDDTDKVQQYEVPMLTTVGPNADHCVLATSGTYHAVELLLGHVLQYTLGHSSKLWVPHHLSILLHLIGAAGASWRSSWHLR